MSHFSDKGRRSLESSSWIKSVGANQVQFTAQFKLKALELQSEGLGPADIFLKLGIDPNLFLKNYPKKCLYRWRKIVEAHGPQGLEQERRGTGSTGRPKKEKPKGERALLERIAFLEEQVDFLKKLRALAEKPKNK